MHFKNIESFWNQNEESISDQTESVLSEIPNHIICLSPHCKEMINHLINDRKFRVIITIERNQLVINILERVAIEMHRESRQ